MRPAHDRADKNLVIATGVHPSILGDLALWPDEQWPKAIAVGLKRRRPATLDNSPHLKYNVNARWRAPDP